jgi:hypothetical protein
MFRYSCFELSWWNNKESWPLWDALLAAFPMIHADLELSTDTYQDLFMSRIVWRQTRCSYCSLAIWCFQKDTHLQSVTILHFGCLRQWFSNGALREVARCAANIMKVCFKNEKKPICIEIYIHRIKYINIFLIFYAKCARKLLYVLQCAANQKRFRNTGLRSAGKQKRCDFQA